MCLPPHMWLLSGAIPLITACPVFCLQFCLQLCTGILFDQTSFLPMGKAPSSLSGTQGPVYHGFPVNELPRWGLSSLCPSTEGSCLFSVVHCAPQACPLSSLTSNFVPGAFVTPFYHQAEPSPNWPSLLLTPIVLLLRPMVLQGFSLCFKQSHCSHQDSFNFVNNEAIKILNIASQTTHVPPFLFINNHYFKV